MDGLSLHAFNGLSGAHMARIPCESASWSDVINESGSLSATVPYSAIDLDAIARPYYTILAVIGFGRVLHAGYLLQAKNNRDSKSRQFTAGGGLSVLKKRLVINYNLYSRWKDGTVVVDEDNPSGDWPFTVTGSDSDLISKLIRETLKWGALPIIPAELTGGNKTRTYNSYDFDRMDDRISDIGKLEAGPEYRFDPQVSSDGYLSFRQVTSADGGEIVDNHWQWNATIPESGVVMGDEDADGEEMCTQCFGVGGKSDDSIVVARTISGKLTAEGWPVLQIANTEHSSVSNVATLKSFTAADTAAGDNPQKTIGVQVDMRRYAVHVGDWADVRVGPAPDDVLKLKITNVSGNASSAMLQLQCRERV